MLPFWSLPVPQQAPPCHLPCPPSQHPKANPTNYKAKNWLLNMTRQSRTIRHLRKTPTRRFLHYTKKGNLEKVEIMQENNKTFKRETIFSDKNNNKYLLECLLQSARPCPKDSHIPNIDIKNKVHSETKIQCFRGKKNIQKTMSLKKLIF